MHEKKSENLYFIAIIPPEPVYGEVIRLKHYFKDMYNSKASLNSPPHITLHMPFRWKMNKEAILINGLKSFAAQQKSFEVRLHNFSAFEPRVIFIDVFKDEKTDIIQKQLKRFCKTELNLFNANYKEFAYHPHITLAFRDLKKSEFYKAWEDFKNRKIEAMFTVSSIALLKHDGTQWKIFENLPLIQ